MQGIKLWLKTWFCVRITEINNVIENSLRHLITDEQGIWLRNWIRTNSLCPNGSKVTLGNNNLEWKCHQIEREKCYMEWESSGKT